MGTTVVFGGGALGAAVARAAHARGEGVVVASRNEGSHPGWWRRCEIGVESRITWMPKGAHVVFAVGPGPSEGFGVVGPAAKLLSRLARTSPASMVVALPAGRPGEPALALASAATECGAEIVRFGPLYGVGDGFLSRHMLALRGGENVRIPKVSPIRWLCADDAARVVFSAREQSEPVVATGSETFAPRAAVDLLITRFGGTQSAPLLGGGLPKALRERLKLWHDLEDSWDNARFGPRSLLAEWIERLPGPRRRGGEASAALS